MYYVYLYFFKSLHFVGFKKTSVRLARLMEGVCREPLGDSKLFDAIWDFYLQDTSLPVCNGTFGCSTPVLSAHDPYHQSCREAEVTELARQAEDDAAAEAYLDSLCQQHGCWEEAVVDGYCQSCWDYNFLCGCGHLEADCHGTCYLETLCTVQGCYRRKVEDDLCQHHLDEDTCMGCGHRYQQCVCPTYDDDPYDHDDEECPGGCGQPGYACVCAELKSWKEYLATPMELRCGPWTP